jgi:hypothetical protein
MKRQHAHKSITYIGPSMKPTLMDLEKLLLCSYESREICSGDVVVINRGEGKKIIHRVISVNRDKIKTMGDNNQEPDPWVLSRDEISGQVIYALRRGRWQKVRGGFEGRLNANYLRARKIFFTKIKLFIKPYYDAIKEYKIIKLKAFSPKTVVFQRPLGEELQLHIGKQIAGRKRPGQVWDIKPQFRPFLDESYLKDGPKSKYDSENRTEESQGG